ncbi:MAG: sigma-70 family RNA polymerase sigma factor [Candidatus Latescibacteria bacterium]|nr:sigma-70 family RNA polymerase sigma factor [Candidatus Latescibacterota bacterium]
MECLSDWVRRAKEGDLDAFDCLVHQFQDMAVGYAYSLISDFHSAEDAAQEAFLAAFQSLSELNNPNAFPGWFRRIVFTHSHRIIRRRQPELISEERLRTFSANQPDLSESLEQQALIDQILPAVDALPDEERAVIALFYIGSYTHSEIASFLSLSPATVNNRLRSARKRLKMGILEMTKQKLQEEAPSRGNSFVNAVGICNASQTGDLGRVVRILETDPKLAKASHPEHARGPLHYAAREGHAEIVRLLLKHGAPLEGIYPNREATSPLALARDRSHTEVVSVIEGWLAENRGTTTRGEKLCEAASTGDAEAIVEILDNHPPALQETDNVGNTALHSAVKNRMTNVVRLLLARGAEVDARNAADERPVHLALFKGMGGRGPILKPSDPSLAALLVGAGAAYDMWVASGLGDYQTVKSMLDEEPGLAKFHNGVKSNAPAGKVFPLTIAAHEGHIEIVRLLLEAGADPNAEIMDSRNEDRIEMGSPLLFAIAKEHFDVAELLLDAEARTDTPTIFGALAVADAAYACKNKKIRDRVFINGGRPMTFTYVKHKDYLMIGELLDRDGLASQDNTDSVIKQIIRWGMYFGDTALVQMSLKHNPQLSDHEWFGVIWEAIRWVEGSHEGKVEAVQMVLDHGISPNLRDKENESLLHRTQGCIYRNGKWNNTEEDMIDYMRVLLAGGADINARDDEMKTTPLGLHARYGHLKVLEFLLEQGAKTNLSGDESDIPPLAWAKKMGQTEAVDLLILHGAK